MMNEKGMSKMTSKENAVLKKAAWKLLSTAVIALSLAGMYSFSQMGQRRKVRLSFRNFTALEVRKAYFQ